MFSRRFRATSARHVLAALTLSLAAGTACATDAARGIEQALAAAQQDKRGVTLYVAGQAIGDAVTRIEPGLWGRAEEPDLRQDHRAP
ncbi:hypothetical protein [Roseateles sp.]|uniref:hypothetical protein n=1 Tax=Roseateles sp. TaxID=1971397 RepID=UPI0032667F32